VDFEDDNYRTSEAELQSAASIISEVDTPASAAAEVAALQT